MDNDVSRCFVKAVAAGRFHVPSPSGNSKRSLVAPGNE